MCRTKATIIQLFSILFFSETFSQGIIANLPPYALSRINKSICEDLVYVKDEKPINCDFDGSNFFMLVYEEDFNNPEDLVNNWKFNLGYTLDDDYELNGDGQTWLGTDAEAFSNNLFFANGNCELLWKKETRNNKVPFSGSSTKNYNFTGGFLNSKFKIREGFFSAYAKLPENQYFWPAFWLYGLNKQEIDVFEFFDHSNNLCETYHHQKITIHHSDGIGGRCSRGRKFPVGKDYFDSFHKYSCFWSDYQVLFFVDNIFIGYATKYYKGPFTGHGGCHYYGEDKIPTNSYDCVGVQNLKNCQVEFPFTNNCILFNKIYKDISFPSTNNSMNLLITNCISTNNNNALNLLNEWNNFSEIDKKIVLDRIEVFQRFNCGNQLSFCTLQEVKDFTGNTNFISGEKITIGHQGTSVYCGFINPAPKQINNWHDFPLHILATEEIEIVGNSDFEEGTYLRAEITNCNIGSNFNERLIQSEKDFNLENFLMNNSSYSLLVNRLIENEFDIVQNVKLEDISKISSINIFPNPANTILQIDMAPEDFNDLIRIEISTILGETFLLPISLQQDLSTFAPGNYFIKFYLTDGHATVKRLIIER